MLKYANENLMKNTNNFILHITPYTLNKKLYPYAIFLAHVQKK